MDMASSQGTDFGCEVQGDCEEDQVKLTTHQAIVRVLSRQWMAGYQVQREVKRLTGRWISESATTARIRDCRKAHYIVETRISKGVHQYRIVKPKGIK
jgi:DNA-binding PadR family transcriptional regulator